MINYYSPLQQKMYGINCYPQLNITLVQLYLFCYEYMFDTFVVKEDNNC